VVAPIASTAEQSRRAFICLQCGDLAESQDEANCSPDPLDARRRAFPTGDVIVWLRRLRTRVSYKQADGIRFPVLRIRPPMKALLPAVLLAAITCPVNAVDADQVAHHDVSFVSQGVTLRGSLYLPKTPSFAAAVWVDGAGDKPRNSGVGQVLAQRGLAVLVYDKRGVGKSGGIYAGPEVGSNNVTRENLTFLADDAAAALQVLRGETPLRGMPLGFIGASQAGWIIPLAALKNRDARFMVLWSGAVETTHEDVLFEQVALPDKEFWDHHTHEEVPKMMARVTDPLAWASFDPREALSKLKIPGLWMFGGRDRNMNVDLSITRLKGLIAAGHPEYSYRMFPDYDHNLGGEQEDVLEPCLTWIRERVTRPLTR